MREVADTRVHGTTGEAPMERFARAEATALRPLNGRPAFRQLRELTRRVQNDACVDIDTNHYSVPWRLIGTEVTVQVGGGQPARNSARGRRRARAGGTPSVAGWRNALDPVVGRYRRG